MKTFVRNIKTDIIYQVFQIDGSVVRVYNRHTGYFTGQAFLINEIEFVTKEDLQNESELNTLENQSNKQ